MALKTAPTDIGFAQITLSAMNAVATSESPFTYKQQVVQHTGQAWKASVTIPPVRRDLGEPWVAFLLSLRGPVGTFTLGDPLGATPAGGAKDYTDILTLKAAVTAGDTSLTLTGATSSVTNYLKAGDYIQIGTADARSLHKVLADASSDGVGDVLITNLFPAVRTDRTLGTSVVVFDTKGLFRLTSGVSSWTLNNADVYGISFEAVEVV